MSSADAVREEQRTGFSAGRALTWLGSFGAFGLGLSALYAITGAGVGCPFKALTGWDCPFCGGTRLGSALLHGDVAAAFAFNPLVFLGLIVLSVLGLVWSIEVFGGPRIRPPAGLAARLRRVRPNTWWLAAGAVAVAYVLVRNLV